MSQSPSVIDSEQGDRFDALAFEVMATAHDWETLVSHAPLAYADLTRLAALTFRHGVSATQYAIAVIVAAAPDAPTIDTLERVLGVPRG